MSVSVSLTVSESSVNVANNTSVVTCKLKATTSGSSYNNYGMKFKITIDGHSSTSTIAVGKSTTKSKTYSRTITHSADGSRSVSCKGVVTTGISAGTITKSKTITLTNIPRASSISIENDGIDLGGRLNINIARPPGTTFKHTLTYAFGDLTGTIVGTDNMVDTSATWDIPTSLGNQIPTAASGTGTIYCNTYNGDTYIGQKTCSFTVNIPSNIKPTISSTPLSKSSFTSYRHFRSGLINTYLIKNINSLVLGIDRSTITMVSGGYGASLKSYTITGPQLNASGAWPPPSTLTTEIMDAARGSLTYTITATDTRGRSNSKSVTLSGVVCYDYSPPSINSFSISRCGLNGDIDEMGDYIKCNYDILYTGKTGTYIPGNSADVDIYYSSSAGSNSIDNPFKLNANNVIINPANSQPFEFDIAVTWNIWASITDMYNSTYSVDPNTQEQVIETARIDTGPVVMPSANKIVNVKSNGLGIAIGKMAETDYLVDSSWPIKSQGKDVLVDDSGNNYIKLGSVALAWGTLAGSTGWTADGSVTVNSEIIYKSYKHINFPSEISFTDNPLPKVICSAAGDYSGLPLYFSCGAAQITADGCDILRYSHKSDSVASCTWLAIGTI